MTHYTIKTVSSQYLAYAAPLAGSPFFNKEIAWHRLFPDQTVAHSAGGFGGLPLLGKTGTSVLA